MAFRNLGKGALRTAKNYTKGYSDTQAKVREATSNDPWGPSGTQMNEIAQLTYNDNDFVEIMEMLDKRLNDRGKNWRHVFKALTLLDYCLHAGSEKVVIYFRDNTYLLKALKEFQYIDEDGKGQGANVRQKAKDVTNLLMDEARLRQERRSRTSIRDRMLRSNNDDDDDENGGNSRQQSMLTSSSRAGRDLSDDELNRALEISIKEEQERVAKLSQGSPVISGVQSNTTKPYPPPDDSSRPIVFNEDLQLTSIGVQPDSIGFQSLTLESDRFICVREKVGEQNQVVIVDLADANKVIRKPIIADSAIMNPKQKILALKAQRQLQIFNINTNTRLKSHMNSEDVIFWKWISNTTIGLVTETAVHHWTIADLYSPPQKIFDRLPSLTGSQIINYRATNDEKWLILVGIAGNTTNPAAFKIKGSIQLYSRERNVSQPIDGHAASFADFTLDGAATPTSLFAFSVRTATSAKLYIVEIYHNPANPIFIKKVVDVYFPPEAVSDFPVSMQFSKTHGILYLVTKYGFIHLYDVESGACLYMNRISGETIFVTAEHEATGGIIGVNKKGQVLRVGVNEQTIIPYILKTLKNVELARKIASRFPKPNQTPPVTSTVQSSTSAQNLSSFSTQSLQSYSSTPHHQKQDWVAQNLQQAAQNPEPPPPYTAPDISQLQPSSSMPYPEAQQPLQDFPRPAAEDVKHSGMQQERIQQQNHLSQGQPATLFNPRLQTQQYTQPPFLDPFQVQRAAEEERQPGLQKQQAQRQAYPPQEQIQSPPMSNNLLSSVHERRISSHSSSNQSVPPDPFWQPTPPELNNEPRPMYQSFSQPVYQDPFWQPNPAASGEQRSDTSSSSQQSPYRDPYWQIKALNSPPLAGQSARIPDNNGPERISLTPPPAPLKNLPNLEPIGRLFNSSTSSTYLGVLMSLEELMKQRPAIDLTSRVTIPNSFKNIHGGYATVYTGVLDGKPVAVKVLRATRNTRRPAEWEQKLQRSLTREINVWAALLHPNIAEFLGYTVDFGDFAAMVSPWCELGTAVTYLSDGSIGQRERVLLSLDVASGLQYLHDLKIIHGDLKPTNILISDDRTARLTDFGLVRLEDWQGPAGMTTTTPYTGTERYKAPELFMTRDNKFPVATFEGDIHALGCICFEFVTSRQPYSAYDNVMDLRQAIEERDPPATRPRDLNSEFGGHFWNLLEECWSWYPENRPPVVEVVESLKDLSNLESND